MQYVTTCLRIFQHFFSLYNETFGKKEERVEVVKEEEREDPSIHKGTKFQFNYEDVRTLSWIFGLVLILIFILARRSINPDTQTILRKEIIIHETIEVPEYIFLNSEQLSFIWTFCNRTTLNCSWCPPGWTEHDSRCYLMSNDTQTWKKAKTICRLCLGNLPVVLNERDQMFLSRLATQYNKTIIVNGVWIGLRDIEVEGSFTWVNGKKLALNNSFWLSGNTTNPLPQYNNNGMDEDCVAIIPQKNDTKPYWHYNWDDIVCTHQRHFICEIPHFLLDAHSYMTENLIPPGRKLA